MERDIYRPLWSQRGIRSNNMGAQEVSIYGADTETVNGKPDCFQVWGQSYKGVVWTGPRKVTEHFLDLLWDKVPSGSRIFLHNLEFDLPVLFFPFLKFFQKESFEMKAAGFYARVLFGKVNYCELRVFDRTWTLVDTFAFLKGSLATLSKTFDLPAKLPKPRGLGAMSYRKHPARKSFEAYALRDAEVACRLGSVIMDFHKEYDVKPCLSAPHLSAQIFRHRFIPEGQVIPSNPRDLDEAAVLSYHGGKNGLYVPPGIYKDVRVYDINSAFPYAMSQLPNFLGCEYEHVPEDRATEEVHTGARPGIYCIDGTSVSLTYNLIRDHKFQPVLGEFRGLWLTSYEINVARRLGFVRDLRAQEGFCVIERKRRPNPLADFVAHFYRLKHKEKGPKREFYKLMLNSLYGKFIQNILTDDGDLDLTEGDLRPVKGYYQAGGLWNPLLASLITGFVRAHLTELEVRYQSLHSSTDSIITRQKAETGTGLGELSLKTGGTVVLLRPKLYLVWNNRNEMTAYALHGYHGWLAQFIRLLRSGKRNYAHRRMRKIKEAARQGLAPLTMETFFKTINLNIQGPLNIPKLKVTLMDGKRIVV
jgi:DNA polymerase family B